MSAGRPLSQGVCPPLPAGQVRIQELSTGALVQDLQEEGTLCHQDEPVPTGQVSIQELSTRVLGQDIQDVHAVVKV